MYILSLRQCVSGFITKADIAAARYQNSRAQDTATPATSTHTYALFNKMALSIATKTSTSLLSTYFKCLCRYYVIPLCIDNQIVTSGRAKVLLSLINFSIDSLFYSLSNVIAAHLIGVLCKLVSNITIISCKKYLTLTVYQEQLLLNALALLFQEEPVATLLATPFIVVGNCLATTAAFETIKKLPKFHPDPPEQAIDDNRYEASKRRLPV